MRRTRNSWLIDEQERWYVRWDNPSLKQYKVVQECTNCNTAVAVFEKLRTNEKIRNLAIFRERSIVEKLYIKGYATFEEQQPK